MLSLCTLVFYYEKVHMAYKIIVVLISAIVTYIIVVHIQPMNIMRYCKVCRIEMLRENDLIRESV
jgi:uncharacterized membrane protein